MINNFKKIAYIFIVGLTVLISTFTFSFAETKSELQAEKKSIDEQIAETNSEIAGVKSKMSTTLNQITRLNSQISSYEDEIDELQSQLNTLNSQIAEKEKKVEEEQKLFDEQQDALNKRLVALYESGTTSYLDMLLNADGLADFISKYYMIEQLAEYDQDLLKKIEETKIQLENEKNALENSKKEVETAKNTMEVKRNSLSVSVKEKNSLVSNLTEEEKSLEEQLEQFEKDKKAIQAKLAAIAAKSSKSSNAINVAPSAAGYISPLSGKSKANITTGYYGYSGHTGVDFACSSGTPIHAVKSGTVVISEALKYSNGNYRSYGEYIVIDHGDGTMTLYGHGSPGTRQVSVGQSVSQGQQIMSVGSTGNSTGPHLHFEVRIGGKCVNPTPYLP